MQQVISLGLADRRYQKVIDWIKLGEYTFVTLDSELTIVSTELHLRLNSKQLTLVECADAPVGVYEGELSINEAPTNKVTTPFLSFHGPKISYTILVGILDGRPEPLLDIVHDLCIEDENCDRTVLNFALRKGQVEHFLQVMRDARAKFTQK